MSLKKVNGTAAWLHALLVIHQQGSKVAPRGKDCKELTCYQTMPINMHDPLVLEKTRNIGYKFMFAEAWWILTGQNAVATIAPYSKEIRQFSNDGLHFDGAYGPRVVDQLRYVIDALHKDQDTRQAVMTIWRQNPRESKDIPCTVALQFYIRDGELNCHAFMRSSDVWLGLPYDMFNFSAIAWYIFLELQRRSARVLRLGNLTITATSMHLYAWNDKAAEKVFEHDDEFYNFPMRDPILYHGWSTTNDLIAYLQDAKDIGLDAWMRP